MSALKRREWVCQACERVFDNEASRDACTRLDFSPDYVRGDGLGVGELTQRLKRIRREERLATLAEVREELDLGAYAIAPKQEGLTYHAIKRAIDRLEAAAKGGGNAVDGPKEKG